jgi:hypothetical protein
MASQGHFYGMEGGTKLYKIYVTDGALCGAKVAGQIHDEKSARVITMQFGLLGMLLGNIYAKRAVKKREETEASYDAMEAGGPPFLTADKVNFSLGPAKISKIEINGKRKGVKNILKSEPALEMQLADGKKRKFMLIGDQNIEYIRNLVSKVVPATSIVE